MEYYIITFGYIALILGTFLEGETVLIIGGYLAHNGYLKLQYVMISAFIGSFSGDQLYFFIGRIKGKEFIDSKPAWKPKVDRFNNLLQRFHAPLILGFRFLYGLRIISPFVIGASDIPLLTFLLLNVAGAVLWSVVFAFAGYFFGHAVEIILDDIKRYEWYVVLFIMLISILIFLLKYKKKKIKN